MKVYTTNIPDNLRVFLALIQHTEGTDKYPDPYVVRFGGTTVQPDQPHDGIIVSVNGYHSTALGAYQFLYNTWLDIHNGANPPMTPAEQDQSAIVLITEAGAYGDIIDGNWTAAINKTNKIWASLPGSPYGQPVATLTSALYFIQKNLAATGLFTLAIIALLFFC